ncbi:MAG: XRE family transcriptional regulator [Rhodanobacteraceae bacterium]|nr:MAG: XRE family transcriptional regulator [Rhodanobacteraceae bacterium]
MDIVLASPSEILAELGARLHAQRLAQNVPQKVLASMAGVSVGALQNAERNGVCSLETFVRVACALGLAPELSDLFVLRPKTSIAQMERAAATKRRRRASRKSRA